MCSFGFSPEAVRVAVPWLGGAAAFSFISTKQEQNNSLHTRCLWIFCVYFIRHGAGPLVLFWVLFCCLLLPTLSLSPVQFVSNGGMVSIFFFQQPENLVSLMISLQHARLIAASCAIRYISHVHHDCVPHLPALPSLRTTFRYDLCLWRRFVFTWRGGVRLWSRRTLFGRPQPLVLSLAYGISICLRHGRIIFIFNSLSRAFLPWFCFWPFAFWHFAWMIFWHFVAFSISLAAYHIYDCMVRHFPFLFLFYIRDIYHLRRYILLTWYRRIDCHWRAFKQQFKLFACFTHRFVFSLCAARYRRGERDSGGCLPSIGVTGEQRRIIWRCARSDCFMSSRRRAFLT